MSKIRSFEDLDCFKFCKELRLDISELVKSFPLAEQYRLTDQMIRCSRSTTNNLAEGYGRFHFKENIQFCRISRGSLYELLDHLQIAFENNFINVEKLSELEIKIESCLKLTNGYINYLNTKLSSNTLSEPEVEYKKNNLYSENLQSYTLNQSTINP